MKSSGRSHGGVQYNVDCYPGFQMAEQPNLNTLSLRTNERWKSTTGFQVPRDCIAKANGVAALCYADKYGVACGQEFTCEICGGQSYWGRRAFERHFKEWRHQNGMRALGIPNTKTFFEVTQMKDALELWNSIKVSVHSIQCSWPLHACTVQMDISAPSLQSACQKAGGDDARLNATSTCPVDAVLKRLVVCILHVLEPYGMLKPSVCCH